MEGWPPGLFKRVFPLIAQFLTDPADRRSARRVCRSWNDILDPSKSNLRETFETKRSFSGAHHSITLAPAWPTSSGYPALVSVEIHEPLMSMRTENPLPWGMAFARMCLRITVTVGKPRKKPSVALYWPNGKRCRLITPKANPLTYFQYYPDSAYRSLRKAFLKDDS